MRKLVISLAGMALLCLLAASFAALYVQVTGIPHYDVEQVELEIQQTPAQVERGKFLATLICVGCHLDERTGRLSGKRLLDIPSELGVAYAQNITRDRTHGIGVWSAGEIAYFLRTGVRPTGQLAPPWMPRQPLMSDEDLASVIAFLRSDDPLVAATPLEPPASQPTFLLKMLCHTAFKKLPYPKARIDTPPIDETREHGRYLVTILDCYPCHSESFKTIDVMHPEKSLGYLGGGNPLVDLTGQPIRSANITSDEETGIGRWSREDFVRALRTGVRPDHTMLRYPMQPRPQLSDAEASSIFDYLRSVPKIHNQVTREAQTATAKLVRELTVVR